MNNASQNIENTAANRKKLRVGFMGTPDFALVALQSIVNAGFDVVCVYAQPPRPKGRGQHVQLSPVHAYAQSLEIPVFTPVSLKDVQAQEEFAAHNLDVAVVAAYGLILPESVLNAPRYGCLNIHGSLLPRWRGAAPIQYAIWKGDTQTGITIMQMEKGLDTGPMIAKRAMPITALTNAAQCHDELATMGGDMIVETLDILANNGQVVSEKQDDAMTCYASMLKKEDGIVDWNTSAFDIDRQVRALNPWPGVWTVLNGKRLKILACHAEPDNRAHQDVHIQPDLKTGSILDKTGHVLCGENTILQLLSVQPEGKKAMDVSSALNGGYLQIGSCFS